MYSETPYNIKHQINILVAEDNIINQKVIEVLIKLKGWHCFIVDNGEKAVEECKKGNYNLILMDIGMPVMDGFEAAKIIRETNSKIPIIALTAYTDNFFKEKSIEAGMNYFLSKPYKKEVIYSTINKCLSN